MTSAEDDFAVKWTYNARFLSEMLRRIKFERARLFVRSIFDRTVCSEPLAVFGGRGVMGIQWWVCVLTVLKKPECGRDVSQGGQHNDASCS